MVHENDERAKLKMILKREIAKLEKERDEATDSSDQKHNSLWLQQIADSLRSTNITNNNQQKNIEIKNIFSGVVETVALNPKLSIEENAELYAKKAKKANAQSVAAMASIQPTIDKIKQLQSALSPIIRPENDAPEFLQAAIDAARKLINEEPANSLPPALHPNTVIPPFRFYTIKGWNILAGKSDKQNDELSTRFTKSNDLWFHAAGCAGSHLIIQRPQGTSEIDDDVLRSAASLAAWFSKARNAPFVEVHYTEGRHVHKNKNAPTGEVYLDKYRLVKVKPQSPEHLHLLEK